MVLHVLKYVHRDTGGELAGVLTSASWSYQHMNHLFDGLHSKAVPLYILRVHSTLHVLCTGVNGTV